MFSQRLYLEVNREERFYCFLLGHALLASPTVRNGILHHLSDKLRLDLPPDRPLQVFVEVAALRDYWCDLGNAVRYSQDTHVKRRGVLAVVLREMGFSEDVIDAHDLFWTSESHKKLWCPGRWSADAIAAARLDPLVQVKWAFNGKPDMMLVSDSQVIMIEAKVESPEGRDANGYAQFETQKLIARLMKRLIPAFGGANFTHVTLAADARAVLSWKTVCSIVEDAQLDFFTTECFRQMARFHR